MTGKQAFPFGSADSALPWLQSSNVFFFLIELKIKIKRILKLTDLDSEQSEEQEKVDERSSSVMFNPNNSKLE
jgi:hypothetical protein